MRPRHLTRSESKHRSSTLAVTLGDPRGIGPDVARRAAVALHAEDGDAHLVFIAPSNVEDATDRGAVWDARPIEPWDGTDKGAGRVSALAVEAAVRMALAGEVGGLVTAPIHKPALHDAGWDVPGHTELLMQLAHAPAVGMLMCAEETRLGGPLRVLLATTHLPLRDVPDAVTEELVSTQVALLDHALRTDWGMGAPRIALCGLNPHASDEGLFGDEEARVLEPAARRLRERGVDVSGPVPADTVFTRAIRGDFDAVVVPYHDVGMAAFKTASFGIGVNVTIGLPFVRTSPDHGTAFDLASTPDLADEGSMLEAMRLALRLSRERFDRESRDV